MHHPSTAASASASGLGTSSIQPEQHPAVDMLACCLDDGDSATLVLVVVLVLGPRHTAYGIWDMAYVYA